MCTTSLNLNLRLKVKKINSKTIQIPQKPRQEIKLKISKILASNSAIKVKYDKKLFDEQLIEL
jgi:hypothetical protein